MEKDCRRVLVTGGAGFIGSALCRLLVEGRGYHVVNVDKLTYAGSVAALHTIVGHPRYRFERCDIADAVAIAALLRQERIGGIIHLAAETHVDRSIASPQDFIETNILGTFRLLEAARDYWSGLEGKARRAFRFHHVSTDEVFGDAHDEVGEAISETRYRPSSPYSASKAAADHLVSAWQRTYGLPALITNSTNTYGPFQYPDKLIPLTITNALNEQPLPVYGTGSNVRDWLHVDDHVRALAQVFECGEAGMSYHFSSGVVRSNLTLVETICALLDDRRPRAGGKLYRDLIRFVPDRPGHDRRYRLDSQAAAEAVGWRPSIALEAGLAETVDWYIDRDDWWRPLWSADIGGTQRPQASEKTQSFRPERRQA